MNRLLFNRGFSSSSLILRNYSVKPTLSNIGYIPKEPARFVYKPVVFQFSNHCLKQFFRQQSTVSPLNANTLNLTKDVIIFKYENPRHYKIMNLFGIVQFFFWVLFAEFTISSMKYVPVDKEAKDYNDLPFYLQINLGENKYKWGLAMMSFFVGIALLGFVWVFTLRSVRYLILRKGGKEVSFVTYGPFGTNRILNVPLNCVSAVQIRSQATSSLPIKVKNKTFYFMLDNRGIYTNGEIFDRVINLKRRIE